MPLVTKTFSDIITFTRTSGATYFDSNGVLQTAGNNVPRFDYNPATLAAQGLLIEEARTNSIRNNTMQGAVAGTPGTLPQVSGVPSWNVSNLGTLTREVVGTGIVNGITYIDLRFSGTTSTTQLSIRLEPGGIGAIAAANGQTWAMSMWSAIVAGSLTNITGGQGYGTLLYDAAGAFIGAPFSSGVLNTTSTLVRTQTSGTIATAGAAFIQPQIFLGFASGVAIDITLRIGLPQLENNNISTGVASATVASGGSGYAVGDVLQIVGGTGTAARLTVATLSGSAVATVTVSTAGSYSVFPSPQPVSVTAITGTGTSATFNIVPQTQTGFATSVIPTTTTALTRSADVASVNTLSPWYNASEGTLFAESSVNYTVPGTFFPLAASLNDNSSNNRIEIGYVTSAVAGFEVSTGGTSQAGLYPSNAAQIRKTAGAYAANDFAVSTNGSAASVDTSGSVPTVTRLALGARTTGGTVIHLRRVTYYPRRLSNAELQAITA